MKKLLLIIPFLAVMLACQKDPVPVSEDGSAEITFSIDLPSPQTKASEATVYSWENTVNSIQYYIFNAEGRLEAYFMTTSPASVTRSVSIGRKTVWAVVNVPESRFSGCTSLSDFLSRGVSFADIASYNFPMSGSVSTIITTGSNTVSVQVSQLVCRVIFKDISNALDNSLQGEDFSVGNIFLSNVVCNSRIDGSTPSALGWSSQCGRCSGATSPDEYVEWEEDVSYPLWTFCDESTDVIWDECYCMGDFFYFFPNPTVSDTCGWTYPFTPRYTRIVVEIFIRGERYYYPINLNGAKRNHSYDLHLTVTRPGSLDPDTFDWAEIQDVNITIGGFDDFDDDLEIIY